MAILQTESFIANDGFDGADLFDRFRTWAGGANDVGTQTRSVLFSGGAWDEAAEHHYLSGNKAAGNGSLMRATPTAVRYAMAPIEETVRVARDTSAVTHGDPAAGWGTALLHVMVGAAVRGEDAFEALGRQLAELPEDQDLYRQMLGPDWEPSDAKLPNGTVWGCLAQAVWAVRNTDSFDEAVVTANDLGGDTDTVAAVTGGLAGALYGIGAIPSRWTTYVHGHVTTPEGKRTYRLADLHDLTRRLLGGRPVPETPAESPHGPKEIAPGLHAADLGGASSVPTDWAVMSLCRVGDRFQDHSVRREFYLIDKDSAYNADLATVVDDAVTSIDALLAEDRQVVVHCHGGHSRTGLILRAWLMRHHTWDAETATDHLANHWSELGLWNDDFTAFLRGLSDVEEQVADSQPFEVSEVVPMENKTKEMASDVKEVTWKSRLVGSQEPSFNSKLDREYTTRMPRNKWFFQANPKMYDVDSALTSLEQIWWRVPQYTSDIHRGDVALLWRSGPDAGVIGIGRVAGEPQEHGTPENELRFVIEPELAGLETRVPVLVRPLSFVSKDEIRAIGNFEDHSIIKAPMGSVFPISDADFALLRSVLGDVPPDLPGDEHSPTRFPPPFAWRQRAKSVYPMPGGYDEYLESLRALMLRVEDERPTRSEVPQLVESEFDISEYGSKNVAAFLRRAGFVVEDGELVEASSWIRQWMTTSDPGIVIGLLHSRVRFIGEMLHTVESPKTISDILHIANDDYRCGWSTKAQVDRRRGWLQSAGMVEMDESNRIIITDAGQSLLSELDLYSAELVPAPAEDDTRRESGMAEPAPSTPKPVTVNVLLEELKTSSVESSDSARFERAVRDAFEWLGFQAQWLGGPGKTDVLLDASMGRGKSYRVIVDCKTSASGSVKDTQVDWETLNDHLSKHDADHALVVAPTPTGDRLFKRATKHDITVIAVDELITLCEQHANAPLDLETYRSLFVSGGAVNTDGVAERAEEWLDGVDLARAVIATISGQSEKFGTLTAHDLLLLLADDPAAESTTEDDLQRILDTLGGPLVTVLHGDAAGGYRLTTPKAVARFRLGVLAQLLFGEAPGESATPD